jgi:FPC/CPF motif-containing protein YcgG
MNQAMVEKINNDFKNSSKVSFEEFLITEKIITEKKPFSCPCNLLWGSFF